MAVTIVDLSKCRDRFTLSTRNINPVITSSLKKGGGLRTQFVQATAADRAVRSYAAQLEKDPIGGEDFSTVHETRLSNGVYGSLHYMYLGGKEAQKYHYHPPGRNPSSGLENPDSSRRHVLLYPLYDASSNEGGITFEWFDTQNTRLVHPRGAQFPHVEGDAVSPIHRVTAEPGHVMLVTFGEGVHRFSGLGFAMSGHFLDVANGNTLGSFLGNTAGWKGNQPEEIREVSAIESGQSPETREIRNADLATLTQHHAAAMKERIDKHIARNAGQPLSGRDFGKLLKDLTF